MDSLYSPNDMYDFFHEKEDKDFSVTLGVRNYIHVVRLGSQKQNRVIAYFDSFDQERNICLPHSRKFIEHLNGKLQRALQIDFSNIFDRIHPKKRENIHEEAWADRDSIKSGSKIV